MPQSLKKPAAMQVVAIRLSKDIIKQLPKPSLKGERAEFIRAAIQEKLERERVG